MGSVLTNSQNACLFGERWAIFRMARGNGGDEVFVTDDDRKPFLFRLGQVCASHGWKVHAWVLNGFLHPLFGRSVGRWFLYGRSYRDYGGSEL